MNLNYAFDWPTQREGGRPAAPEEVAGAFVEIAVLDRDDLYVQVANEPRDPAQTRAEGVHTDIDGGTWFVRLTPYELVDGEPRRGVPLVRQVAAGTVSKLGPVGNVELSITE